MAGGWPPVTHKGTGLNTLLHMSSLGQVQSASLGSPQSHPDPAEHLTLGNVPGMPCPQVKAFLLCRREGLGKRKRMRKVVGRACGKGQKHFADSHELRSKMLDLSKNTTTLARVHGNS